MASPLEGSGVVPRLPGGPLWLLRLAANLLAVPLARERLLRASLVTRLQIEAVLLDVLDDVFLLDLALEAPQGVLDRFALLHLDLGQNVTPPDYRGFFERENRSPLGS